MAESIEQMDPISEIVLDGSLTSDPKYEIARETRANRNVAKETSEIIARKIDHSPVARKTANTGSESIIVACAFLVVLRNTRISVLWNFEHKVAREIGFDPFIDALHSVYREVFKFRGPVMSTLKDSIICKTDDTFDNQMDVTRITYMKAGEQERDVIIKSAALVDHEKSTLTNPSSCKTDMFEEQEYETRFQRHEGGRAEMCCDQQERRAHQP